ncbi:MAG TPA: hypothetical protein VGF59_23295 [Bryobacteraceae bacterium]|jgi:hypothetical protein
MKPVYRGIAVAALQCVLVLSVAGKYELDRERLPRVWVRTAPVDPNLPIRGRYVSMRIEVAGAPGLMDWGAVKLAVVDGRLTASPDPNNSGPVRVMHWRNGSWVLTDPVAFFIPEQVPDPSIRPQGEELWVEVSVPKKGPPRPLRLGVKRNGVLTPL